MDLLPELKKTAKQRMQAGGGDQKSGQARMPDPIEDQGQAREKAAKLVAVSARYISDVFRLKVDAPDLFAEVKAGTCRPASGRR